VVPAGKEIPNDFGNMGGILPTGREASVATDFCINIPGLGTAV